MRKIFNARISLAIYLLIVHIIVINIAVYAYNTGDDYPSKYRDYQQDSIVDEWNFYNRECTSFAAWCLNSRNDVAFHNYYGGVRWGDASNWGNAAKGINITVDKNPTIGSVAWWSSGHVAWVKEVNGSNVIIEEYNYKKGAYSSRTISSNSITGFIHIKDISVQLPSKPVISDVTANGTNVSVYWSAVSGATQYTVDFWEATTDTHNYYDTNGTSMTKSLTDGEYAVRVGAKNSAGESGFTNFWYINVVANPIPISFDANGGELERTKARINYDSINGERGVDKLVIFTNGGSGTGTNAYGAEVVVSSSQKVTNVIDHVGNAKIPYDGFVLSGHRQKGYWLIDNVRVGDYVNCHPNMQEVWVWTENGWLTWTKKVAYGNRYGTLPQPFERNGYNFMGWFTSPEGGTQVTSETIVNNKSAHTLYAQWEYITPHTQTQVIKNGNSYNISVEQTNLETAKIIVAGYKNNKVFDMEILNNDNLQTTFTGDFDTFKVMAWESVSKLEPLCEAEIIPQNKWIIQ